MDRYWRRPRTQASCWAGSAPSPAQWGLLIRWHPSYSAEFILSQTHWGGEKNKTLQLPTRKQISQDKWQCWNGTHLGTQNGQMQTVSRLLAVRGYALCHPKGFYPRFIAWSNGRFIAILIFPHFSFMNSQLGIPLRSFWNEEFLVFRKCFVVYFLQ